MEKEIIFLPTTDSTNEEVKRLAAKGAKEGTLVVADVQTAGKGRKGRSWITEEKTAIAMSLLLRPWQNAGILPEQALMITLVAAVSVAKALQQVIERSGNQEPPTVSIKWPNDVLVNGKKVCGILTEMSLSGRDIDYVVLGIGVNVNQKYIPEEIAEIATSLFLETGASFLREEVTEEILKQFEYYYSLFCGAKDLGPLQGEYENLLVNLDREVKVLDPKGEYTGVARGIDTEGQLLVQIAGGEIIPVYAGEVSVRGLYGYV